MSEQTIIESLSPDLATIRLTRTMLEKHIIDANESVRRLALLCGIDYQQIGAGEDHPSRNWQTAQIPQSTFTRPNAATSGSTSAAETSRKAR